MQDTVIFQKSYDFYKRLYQNLKSIPKMDRYAWGERCERLALDILALSAEASFLGKTEKRTQVIALSRRIDLLKILLRLGDELSILDHKKYLARSGELLEIGKMAGGWLKSLR